MAWTVLLISAVLEAVWATALGLSSGLSELWPSVVFLVALTLSMVGLGWAAKSIPIGTAYSVWVGIGAALTVAIGWMIGTEAFSLWTALFIAGIVGAVIGLKMLPSEPAKRADAATSPNREVEAMPNRAGARTRRRRESDPKPRP